MASRQAPKTQIQAGGLVGAWRFTKHVMKATDEELRDAVESFERGAFWTAMLVVVGVVAEVLLAIRHLPYDSTAGIWLPAIADIFVAVGVGGEVLLGQLGSNRQKELNRRADGQVAVATERAARADLEAARLRERFSWRTLAPEQRDRMVAALNGKYGVVTLSYMNGDAESVYLAFQIGRVFLDAGWIVQKQAATYGGELWFGLIAPKPELLANESTGLVISSLEAAGIPFNKGSIPSWSGAHLTTLTPEALPRGFVDEGTYLFIGPKDVIAD